MTGNSRSPLCSGMGLPRSTQQNGVLNPGLWPSLGCSSTRRSHHALRSSFGSSRIVFQPFRKVSDGFGLFSDRFGPFRIVFGPFKLFQPFSDRFRPFSDDSILKFKISIGQGWGTLGQCCRNAKSSKDLSRHVENPILKGCEKNATDVNDVGEILAIALRSNVAQR